MHPSDDPSTGRVELPDDLMERRLLNVFEMSKLLGLSANHIRRLASRGRLPKPKRIGGRKMGWPMAVARALVSDDEREVA